MSFDHLFPWFLFQEDVPVAVSLFFVISKVAPVLTRRQAYG